MKMRMVAQIQIAITSLKKVNYHIGNFRYVVNLFWKTLPVQTIH